MIEEQLYVKAMNNKGQIAGSFNRGIGRHPCVVSLDGKVQLLELLPGDVAGEARDINEDSVVVGWSDDAPEADGGPTPCTWDAKGKVTPVKLNELGFGQLYAINNRGQMAGAADVIIKEASSSTAQDAEAGMAAVRIRKE